MRSYRGLLIIVLVLVLGAVWVNSCAKKPVGVPASPPIAAAPETPSTTDEASLGLPMKGHSGTSDETGCRDGLWEHVYHPERLTVFHPCLTITGTIVDASSGRRHDGVRKEKDGDTHGWLDVDPEYKHLLSAGNESDEEGNLVFEIVCNWSPSQPSAISACSSDYSNAVKLPPVGTHVAITGTYVQDENHARWMEIHPVSKIAIVP